MNVRINAIDYSVENASTVFEAASAAGVVAREHIAAKVNGVVSAMSAPVKEGDEILVKAEGYARSVEIMAGADTLLEDNYFDMNGGERRIKVVRGTVEDVKVRSVYNIR